MAATKRATKRQPNERQRAVKAMALRTAGKSYREIAATLGFRDASGAYRAVARLLDRRERESVDELRRIEGQRLDDLQTSLWPKAAAGHLPSVHAVVKIMERRARLFGADAPLGVQVAATVNQHDFARQAVQMLDAIGRDHPAAHVLYEVPGVAELLPAPQVEASDASEPQPWSNIATEDYSGANRAGAYIETEGTYITTGVSGSDHPNNLEAENIPGFDIEVEEEVEELDEPEVIDAEVVEVTSAQRRIPASMVPTDAGGVPVARSMSLRRKLGDRGPYNSVSVRWGGREVLFPVDP